MTYLLQVSTCWILFYGIYLLFLRKETFFSINRYYLMGALLTGLIVPYLGGFIPANEASVEVYQVMTQLTAAEVVPQTIVAEEESIFTWENILWSIYILGGLVVFSRFLYGLNRIYSIYTGATKTPQGSYTLVESDKYHLPFSFFHFIFISKQLPLNADVEKVLKHEELHANQWHSIDIVFTELLQVFFWFNPILIMYKSALRQSHEYLADAYVTQDHNKNSYGQLLLQQSTTGLEVALANQFFHSQIKKRITMMYTEKSKRSAMVKYLAAVPVLVAMLLIFSSNQVEELPRHDVIDNLEKVSPALENEIKEKLRAKGYDLENISNFNSSELEGVGNEIHKIIKSSMDYDIRVDKNGVFVFPPTDLETRDITTYFKSIRDEGRSIRLNVDNGAPSGKVADLLDCAYKNDASVILNGQTTEKKKENMIDLIKKFSLEDHTSGSNNFDGRKITTRNWHSLWYTYKSAKGSIAIKAEANANGDIVYAEIIKDKTTIENKVILKDALKAAKQFKIEKSEKNAFGELIFNLGGSNPQSTYNYNETEGRFKTSSHIRLGQQVPRGSVVVKADGIILKENEDYLIDYTAGMLNITNQSYLDNNTPINVSFKDVQNDPVFKVVEEMPRFPGCEDMEGTIAEKEECSKRKMLEFIYSNLKYPAKARDEGVEGMVVVQFVVEKDGSITGAKIVREIGAGCGAESQKVVNSMPTWIPGKQRGKAVRVRYTLPVKFKLESKAEIKKEEVIHVVGFGDADEKAKKENLQINSVDVSTNTDKSEVFKVVQEMPRFPGCEDMEGTIAEREECAKHKMLEYIYTNIKYPKEARAKGIDGMAVIRMTIEKDGSVNLVNALRDPGAGTGAEAGRVVREMPTWIPGKQDGKAVRVQYTLPVKFKLEGDKKDTKSNNLSEQLKGKTSGVDITKGEKSNIILKSTPGKGPKPLFVIDGKVRPDTNLDEIKADDIEGVFVLKGEKAIEKYGEKGENGVVEITMKGTKNTSKYLIDGQLFGADFYNTIEKSHINKEGPASKEDKFMRGIEGELITVNMLAGYGFNSAYFPGTRTVDDSDAGLMEFVSNNIKYPQVAMDNDIEGLVTVHYTVEADGELTNFKIGRSVGWGIDEAVLEMMEKLADEKGPWRAAYLDRRSVASSMVLPVKFKLQKEQKKEAKTRRLNIERLDISPNPNNGRFDLSFELEEKMPVDIYFYSLSGKLLKSIKGVPSRYKDTIDLSGVQGQTILVNIIQNGKVHTNKVIIQ